LGSRFLLLLLAALVCKQAVSEDSGLLHLCSHSSTSFFIFNFHSFHANIRLQSGEAEQEQSNDPTGYPARTNGSDPA
jgi:hypothetical protein